MYAIDVVNSVNNACGCQSTTDSATEVLLDKAPAIADHVIISTPPATYTQWFKDDPGF